MGAEEKAGIDQGDAGYDTQKEMRVEEVDQRSDSNQGSDQRKADVVENYALAECEALAKTPLGLSMRQDDWQVEQVGQLQDDGTRLQPPNKIKRAIAYHLLALFLMSISTILKAEPDPESPNITWQKIYFQWWAGLHFWPAHLCALTPNFYITVWTASRVAFLISVILFYVPAGVVGWCFLTHMDRVVMLRYTHKQVLAYALIRWFPYSFSMYIIWDYIVCDGPSFNRSAACPTAYLVFVVWVWATIPTLIVDIFFLERAWNYRMESRKLYGLVLFFWAVELTGTTWLFYVKWTFWWCDRPYGPFKYYGPWDVLTRYDKEAMQNDNLTGTDIYTMANPATFSTKGEWERNALPWGWQDTMIGVPNRTTIQVLLFIPITLGLMMPAFIRNYQHGSRNQPGDIVVYSDDDPKVQRPVEFMHFTGWVVSQWSIRVWFVHREVSSQMHTWFGDVPGVNLVAYYFMFFFFKLLAIYSVRTAIGRNLYLPQVFQVQIKENCTILFFLFFQNVPWTFQWFLSSALITLWSIYRDHYLQWHIRRVFACMGFMETGHLQDLLFDEEITLYDCQTCLCQLVGGCTVLLWALTETLQQLFLGESGTHRQCYKSGTGACNHTALSRFLAHAITTLAIIGGAFLANKLNIDRLSKRRNNYVHNDHHKKIDTTLQVTWKKCHDWIPRVLFHKTARDFVVHHFIKMEWYIMTSYARIASMYVFFIVPNIAGGTGDQKVCNLRFWVTYFGTGVYDYRLDLW